MCPIFSREIKYWIFTKYDGWKKFFFTIRLIIFHNYIDKWDKNEKNQIIVFSNNKQICF